MNTHEMFSCFSAFSYRRDWQQKPPVLSGLMYSSERVVKIIQAFFNPAQKVFCPFTGIECVPLFNQRQMHLFCRHACHLSSRQVIAKDEIAVDSIKGRDIWGQGFPSISFRQPVTQPLQAEQILARAAFFSGFHGNTSKDFDIQVKTGFTRIGVVVKKANVINVGRQLIVCIHFFSPKWLMNINRLPVRSDRGLQTYLSENSRAVMGIISLTAVRPAPTMPIPKLTILVSEYLIHFYMNFWLGESLFNE